MLLIKVLNSSYQFGNSPGQIPSRGFGEAGQAISKMTEAYTNLVMKLQLINM